MKYNVPERKFCKGDKKMVSMRLPVDLMAEIRRIAEHKGIDVTDMVMTILNQFAEAEGKKTKKK
jgi:antitoxin component of RelBE/YafQ-DinJ toxin-antitoxin module